MCPRHPLPELFDIKECITDADCAQRICCPEKMSDGKLKGFCRTAEPIWDKLPVVKPFLERKFKIVNIYRKLIRFFSIENVYELHAVHSTAPATVRHFPEEL